jgi:uncharacterized damage-inducible protein DinB
MTADQAAAIVQLLTSTIEGEGSATRKVLAAVPDANRQYKPDPKSRSAWDLAVHLAMTDVWFADSILAGKFEWKADPTAPPEMSDPTAVAKWHETHLTDRLGKLRAMTPDEMLRPIEFFGMKQPAATWLMSMNNHTIHHRGQLAAYLRAAGSKVPAIYGVSADENAFG